MDRKQKVLLGVSLVAGFLLVAVGITRWHGTKGDVKGEEQNEILLGIRGENEDLLQEVTQTPAATGTPILLPEKEPTRQVYAEKPVELTPLEVVEQNKETFDDLLRLIKYGLEPARSKWEIMEELRPYLSDDCYQFYIDYFLHLDLDTELPDYWPTQAGLYAYVYGGDGVVKSIVPVETFVEQYGHYPEQWDIIVIEEEQDPKTIEVTYEQSEEEEMVISVLLQDRVHEKDDRMSIYFEPDGRVWCFY